MIKYFLAFFFVITLFSFSLPLVWGQEMMISDDDLSFKTQIIFDKEEYDFYDTANLKVEHNAANMDSSLVEFVTVDLSNNITSDIKTETLAETGSDTGIFSASFKINSVAITSSDEVIAKYSYMKNDLPTQVTTSAKTIFGFIFSKNANKVLWTSTIDSNLVQLYNSNSPSEFAKKHLIMFENNNTLVTFKLDDNQKLKELQKIGMIQAQSGYYLQFKVSLDNFKQLSELLEDNFARTPTLPNQHEIISAGVQIINSDDVNREGYTGKNIKVAVLDLAFDTGNLEIKNNIKGQKSFRHDVNSEIPITGSTPKEREHGTAVAEIIVDVAPDVELYLYAMGSEVEFLQAIDQAVKDDVNIITMSAGWINYSTDGTSPVTKKIEWAISQGKTVVLSAGNYAQSHWQGTFVDNGARYHNFGNDANLIVRERMTYGVPLFVYLLWDDPSVDFDLFLINQQDGIVVAESNNDQTFAEPYENIAFLPDPNTGPFYIKVKAKNSINSNTNIEIFSTTDWSKNYVQQSSVGIPTDANGAITVGALPINTSDIAPYSSQGPANNNVSVPTVVGPDTVEVSATNRLFQGTSAAAPHVAGVVALLLDSDDTLSPTDVLEKIKQFSNKEIVGIKNSNYIYGYGLIDSSFIINDVNMLKLGSTTESEFQKSKFLSGTDSTTESEFQKSKFLSGTDSTTESEPKIKTKTVIPNWIKEQAKWWIIGATSENEFVDAIQYLIKKEIIVILELSESNETIDKIPDWVKITTKWWTEDKLSDSEFVKGVEFLVKTGIIKV